VDSLLQDSDPIDGQKPNDHCAVIGICGTGEVFPYILSSLKTLQHRGQESAGIATYSDGLVHLKKGMGLISEVFNSRNNFNDISLEGTVGIGHTRYSTAGSKSLENSGPFIVSNSVGHLALSHNGEITNAERIRGELLKSGMTFRSSSDTEVMLMEISRNIVNHGIEAGLKLSMDRLKGAYSITLMINERLFAIRDTMGFRPLCIGRFDGGMAAVSESCALDTIGAEFIRDVKPGEIVELSSGGERSILTVPSTNLAHCMFEYVYFARPDSTIDGREVYRTRVSLGRQLAREHPVVGDVVFAVPDSGRAQALGYSMESGIPYSEGLIKNRFSERTFIMPTQELRNQALKLKLNVISSEVKGKRIVLVDDSIVRGNTMKRIVEILRKAGAVEVHVRIGCPQIISPCYFGVDMKTKDQFLASGRSVGEISREIGADSLGYVSIDGLIRSIDMNRSDMCLSCLTGEYPVDVHAPLSRGQSDLERFVVE
jgi:amidophosphoribosyltransferase